MNNYLKLAGASVVALAALSGCSLLKTPGASPSPSTTPTDSMSPSYSASTGMATAAAPTHATMPAAPSPSASTLKPVRLSATCTPADIHTGTGMAQGAAGSVFMMITFTNAGSHSCKLAGYPGVALTTKQNESSQVGSPATHASGTVADTVTIAPGKAATAVLRIVDAANFPQAQGHTVKTSYIEVFTPGISNVAWLPYKSNGVSDKAVSLLEVGPVTG